LVSSLNRDVLTQARRSAEAAMPLRKMEIKACWRRDVSYCNGCGSGHSRRTCRLGRADDLSCRAASGRLPGHQRGLFCWWEHGCKYCRVCRGGYYGGGCSTV